MQEPYNVREPILYIRTVQMDGHVKAQRSRSLREQLYNMLLRYCEPPLRTATSLCVSLLPSVALLITPNCKCHVTTIRLFAEPCGFGSAPGFSHPASGE